MSLPNCRRKHSLWLRLSSPFAFSPPSQQLPRNTLPSPRPPLAFPSPSPHPPLTLLSPSPHPPLALAQRLTFDHADVVSAVPDGQSDGLLVFLDELHHLRLLQRRDSAADHRLAGARRRHKFPLHVRFQGVCLTQQGGGRVRGGWKYKKV